ncbi:UNVERIFIED_CONTAM: putative ribonuclease H protein [Sesamum radiatum]|uniref:Ribonuclease H protein n=1 Tax=Sesamum radiatum TaxID=300843 RepID=A0AAW2MEZ3_SESRA
MSPGLFGLYPCLLHRPSARFLLQQARGIELCGRSLVRGISLRNLHGKLFDKLHLGGSYLLMSGTVPCGQLFQFSYGGFFKIESQWTRECNKRGSVFHLNRNAAKYRGVPFSTDSIILEVQRHLRTLYAARTLTSTQWKGDLHQAAVMGFIFRQQVSRAPSIVRWHAPSPSWFKLNTDGSSLGNPGLAGAAGIIRDSAGHVHLAYQFALGTATSVLAELTAVWRGMELALTHGLAPLVVEVDATTVISLLQSCASGKWEVQHMIMQIVCLQQLLVADV